MRGDELGWWKYLGSPGRPSPVGVPGSEPGLQTPLPRQAEAPKTACTVNFSDLGTVTPIRTATNKALTPIKVGAYPCSIAITPDGKTAYAANYGSGR